MTSTLPDQMREAFSTYKQRLSSEQPGAIPHFYAIVDSSQRQNMFVELEGLATRLRALSLTASVGPYVVEIDRYETTLEWLLSEGRGKRWSIFVFSRYDFDSVWSHARRFTTVLKPDGEEVSFRYYDPFVFNQYVGILSLKQRQVVFSKFETVFAELGEAVMQTTLAEDGKTIEWCLLSEKPVEGSTAGTMSVPRIDLSGSAHAPLFAFSKQQYEFPIIYNTPLLIQHIEAYLRDDFETRMSAFAPGLLRAMIERAMFFALRAYELNDLEILRESGGAKLVHGSGGIVPPRAA